MRSRLLFVKCPEHSLAVNIIFAGQHDTATQVKGCAAGLSTSLTIGLYSVQQYIAACSEWDYTQSAAS